MTDELIEYMHAGGADKVGIADLRELDPEIREGLPFGISFAVALDTEIITEIKNGPNKRYFLEYRRANDLLDEIGRKTAAYLRGKGYRALSQAATNAKVDWDKLLTKLPHKTVATMAGMGWIGKCNLLVTGEFGSAIRIATVLTDADLIAGEVVTESRCGDCRECVDACPAKAVTGENWSRGMSRDLIYDAFACMKTASTYGETIDGIEDTICGICIAVCPWTKKYMANSAH